LDNTNKLRSKKVGLWSLGPTQMMVVKHDRGHHINGSYSMNS